MNSGFQIIFKDSEDVLENLLKLHEVNIGISLSVSFIRDETVK